MPTYESPTLSVKNREITEHDTDEVASYIRVLSAECRWRGVTTENTTFESRVRNNGVVFPDIYPGDSEIELDIEPLDPEDGGSFDYIEVELTFPNNELGKSATGEVSVLVFNDDKSEIIDSTDTNLGSLEPTGVAYFTTNYTKPKYSLGIDIYNTSDIVFDSPEIIISTGYTVEVAYPDYTEDPTVTKDVSASYSGLLNDGEWSSWTPMSGLGSGVNEIYHSISGSGRAEFEFRYDWEYAYPDAVYEMRFYDADQNAIHRIALADPSDAQLDYNAVRVAINGSVYAVDVVDSSDPDALTWLNIQHPTHGVVHPRAFETVEV